MGKYMRKSKPAGEVALLDVSHTQSSLGVRTRAKTLALQRSTAAAPGAASSGCGDCGSYMQLRSRRLQKPPIGSQPRRHKPAPKDSNPSPKANQNQNKSSRASSKLRQVSSANSGSVNKGDECLDDGKKEDNILQESNAGVEKAENNLNNGDDIAVEGSFGENLPDFEGRERWVSRIFYFQFLFLSSNSKPALFASAHYLKRIFLGLHVLSNWSLFPLLKLKSFLATLCVLFLKNFLHKFLGSLFPFCFFFFFFK